MKQEDVSCLVSTFCSLYTVCIDHFHLTGCFLVSLVTAPATAKPIPFTWHYVNQQCMYSNNTDMFHTNLHPSRIYFGTCGSSSDYVAPFISLL